MRRICLSHLSTPENFVRFCLDTINTLRKRELHGVIPSSAPGALPLSHSLFVSTLKRRLSPTLLFYPLPFIIINRGGYMLAA
jgi:hypothetical protein